MKNVIPFRQKNKELDTRKTPAVDIHAALADYHEQTGIDFLKVVTGDEKENKKLRFKQYQEALQSE